jgi:hypothetical protein
MAYLEEPIPFSVDVVGVGAPPDPSPHAALATNASATLILHAYVMILSI